MTKEMDITFNEKSPALENERSSTLIADLKSLFKAPVLLANALPVFVGFWLALHFTGGSLFANSKLFWLTIIGSTILMGGALVLNNWYDVDIDTVMKRTQQRPTVTGHFSLRTVLGIGITMSAVGLIMLLFTTFEAAVYGFIGWFTYVVMYTMWTKRKYTLNTVIGSVSGAVTPMIGWAAIAPAYHIVPIMLFMILFIWQMPHTFAIAMRKYNEYKAANVAMLPVVRGFKMTKRQMFVYIACLLPLPFYLGSLGMVFIILATILNIGFLAVSIRGFFTKDDDKWAYVMFMYSVNYIAILFLLMVAVTLPI
ncbi:heme o synthase [Sporosarcina saromensis]|uniref:Protoheme IX farnesyltransferase n=1 Tax=Sporosarcina saromensis TaxID=359365 RepID=A0ABU4G6R1_9BACL|nr:heme o synthase [Sporosarcina saromensis]MDW0112015.1 heme o synthase [Sporosarcina saromensis]